jgi:hypothetical protein
MSSPSHGSLSHPNTKMLQCDDGGRSDRSATFYACRRVTAECMIRKAKWDEALSDPLQYGFYLLIPLHPSAPLPSRRRHGACNGRTRPISVHPAIPRRSIGLSLVHITKKLKTPRAHPMAARLILSAGSRGPGGGRQVRSRCAAQASSTVTLVRAIWSFHSAGFIVSHAYGDRSGLEHCRSSFMLVVCVLARALALRDQPEPK